MRRRLFLAGQSLLALPFCMGASCGLPANAFGQLAHGNGQQTQTPRPQPVPPGYRALSLKEGRAFIRKMAWADDEEGLTPDCSHLVHILFERAGYTYPYTSSTTLYRGARQFLRVLAPQPGDLIAWPGHVGIVVNPAEHSFFSSVSSGAHTRDYTSPYWRARGHARFYRYLKPTVKNPGKREAAAGR